MFNKKNKRKITVGANTYFWSAAGADHGISLALMTEVQGAPKFFCHFDYHQDKEPFETHHGTGYSLSNQFVVTPYIVRQVIEFALTKGWRPFEAGADMSYGNIDGEIDLRLDQNRENAIKATQR